MTFGGPVALPAEGTAYGTVFTETKQVEVVGTDATELAVREYFKDIPIMIHVARCESTFRHTLSDGSVLTGRVDSDDTGVMQINKRYHEETATKLGFNLDDLYDNMAYARDLYERKGTQPWSASQPCWGNALAANF